MGIELLIEKNRSYRRFNQQKRISFKTLKGLVNLARLSASARNQQSLKYALSNKLGLNSKIFDCLAWAGYLKNWDGPAEGEKPAAYIVILNDAQIATNHYCDEGIAAQSILLGAVEQNLGGCIIAAIDKPKLTEILQLPKHLDILLVIALGEPAEKVEIEDIKSNDFKYWRDKNGVHHVPKRGLNEIIIDGFDQLF